MVEVARRISNPAIHEEDLMQPGHVLWLWVEVDSTVMVGAGVVDREDS